jgi:PAS domain S-box-containing protein
MNDEILREMFRHTPIGVVITDLHGTILEANDAMCTMIGYPHDQVVGRPAQTYLHPDDVSGADGLLTRLRSADTGAHRATRRLINRSGRVVSANVTLSVVRSADDEPIFGIAFIEDIGERLEMEKALRHSATLYRQVVQDQSEMIVRWKPDGTRSFVNEAYARYFGVPEAELLGTSFFPLIVKEDREMIERKIAGLTPATPTLTDVHRVILADGSVRWNEWTDRATFDDTGRITIIQSIGRDVTDRIEATEALRRSESRYRRLFEHLPIAAWEVDWSEPVAFVRSLGVRSTDEMIKLIKDNPGAIREAFQHLRLLDANASALALAGVETKEEFRTWLASVADRITLDRLFRGIGPIFFDDVDTNYAELTLDSASGELRDTLFQWARVRQSESGWRIITIVLDLTEQKRNEREVLEQKLKLEQAEAMANLGHFEIDVTTWTTTGSAEYWKIYDGREGGPLQRSADDDFVRIHPEDRIGLEAALETVKNAAPGTVPGLPTHWEFRVVRDDGSIRWVRSVSELRPRPDGPPIIYGVDQDVTDQKLIEFALRRNEQIYRDLFHSLPIAVWETDWSAALSLLREQGIETPDQLLAVLEKDRDRLTPIIGRRRVVEANQNALDLFGVHDGAALVNATWPPKVAPGQLSTFLRTLAGVAFGKIPKARFDLQITRPDGTTVDVDALLSCSEAAPGRVISTALDVTDRKKIERNLLDSQRMLEHAQSIAQLGSWEASLQRDEVVGSREYWRIIDGHTDGERTRKLSETMLRVHPEDRDRVWRFLVDAERNSLRDQPSEPLVEFRIVREDGSVRIARGQGVFSRTETGEARGTGILQDITEIKKVEEQARIQREELMRADRMISLGILVSGVAHEINNPNQFIMLNAPLLRNAWNDVAPVIDDHARLQSRFRVGGIDWTEMRHEIPEIIDEIDRGAERIRSIVSELRTFGRDQLAAELRPASLNDIIEGSLRLLSNHIRRATSRFRTNLAPGLPMIEANPQRLEQVIVNLVMNSCQALQRPDAAIRVETSYDVGANSVVMRVIDEGRGIPPENLKNIRDPFFTTKRAEGGMGLGLAVSDRIVQEHNGVLSFESEPGLGTTATLSLPAIDVQEH